MRPAIVCATPAVGAADLGYATPAPTVAGRRHPGEIMTILIRLQQPGYRASNGFCTPYAAAHLRAELP